MDSVNNTAPPRGAAGLRHVDLPHVPVMASAPKREPRKGLGKGAYEAVLKWIPGLRDIYKRWMAGKDPSDEECLRVIWPAVFPLLDLDLEYPTQPVLKGLSGAPDVAVQQPRVVPFSKAHQEVVEDWHWIVNEYKRKVWFEVWPFPHPSCVRKEQPRLFAVVNVMAALLAVEILGVDVIKLGHAACGYHGVEAGRPERRRRPKRIKFDIQAFRYDPGEHLKQQSTVRTCQPPDAWWFVHGAVRAMLSFPPHQRRIWFQPLLGTREEIPSGTWGYMYAVDLAEEMKRTFHVMIGNSGLSQHPFYSGGAVNIVNEWLRLRKDFPDGQYELLVEPALPRKELLSAALTHVSKPMDHTLDEVATWLLLRQAGGPRPGRYHIDPVERARHHDLLMYLLSRHLGKGKVERWIGAEAMAQSIPRFSAKPWLTSLRRGEGWPAKHEITRTPLNKLLAMSRERRKTNREGPACQEKLLGSDQGIVYGGHQEQLSPEQILQKREEDLG